MYIIITTRPIKVWTGKNYWEAQKGKLSGLKFCVQLVNGKEYCIQHKSSHAWAILPYISWMLLFSHLLDNTNDSMMLAHRQHSQVIWVNFIYMSLSLIHMHHKNKYKKRKAIAVNSTGTGSLSQFINNKYATISNTTWREYGKPGTPEQPGSAGTDKFLRRGHVQAAIIQTIKQDKPLSNYFTVLKH